MSHKRPTGWLTSRTYAARAPADPLVGAMALTDKSVMARLQRRMIRSRPPAATGPPRAAAPVFDMSTSRSGSPHDRAIPEKAWPDLGQLGQLEPTWPRKLGRNWVEIGEKSTDIPPTSVDSSAVLDNAAKMLQGIAPTGRSRASASQSWSNLGQRVTAMWPKTARKCGGGDRSWLEFGPGFPRFDQI